MRRKRLAPLLAAAGLIATSLPLLTGTQATAAPAVRYLDQKPEWQRCGPDQPESLECATLKAPLDYQRPDGPMIDLAVSRIKSADPAKRRGVLLINPGGPGGPGLDWPLITENSLPKDVRDQYDLVGFDPRGAGKSSPVSCELTVDNDFGQPYRPETFDSDVARAKTVADECRKNAGEALPYITTRNTARDMDTIREVLGEKKISYMGFSYGTYLGAVYSQMFPQQTDRFVLDSGVDPGRVWRGMQQVWASESEPAFTRWTQWAAERNAEFGLGDSPKAVSDTFWALVARADKEPIKIDTRYWPAETTGDDIRRSTRGEVFYPESFSEMFTMLKAAADGKPMPAGTDPARLKKLLDGGTAGGPTGWGGGGGQFWPVLCGDTAWPDSPEQYAKDAARDKKDYPLYGDIASNIKPCAFWDKPLEPATPMNKEAKVLILQNEWDSQTPLASAQGLRHALEGSRMVTVADGEGHIAYHGGSCAKAPANTYLTTGRLPDKDVTCTNPAGGTSNHQENTP
ncbi:alpha/beta hydrolase [Streptomyces erythrochromogenes]|uniref:alpha/beta hydrolase n=1 Tax=Streptomyces erythrochromogenes TaxID=285574 RepID=UPI003446EB12